MNSRRQVLESQINKRDFKFNQRKYQMTRRHVIGHVAAILHNRIETTMDKIMKEGQPVRESSLVFKE